MEKLLPGSVAEVVVYGIADKTVVALDREGTASFGLPVAESEHKVVEQPAIDRSLEIDSFQRAEPVYDQRVGVGKHRRQEERGDRVREVESGAARCRRRSR